MLELFTGFVTRPVHSCRVSAQSESQGDLIELTFVVEQTPDDGQPMNPQAVEQRMELILAREWLAVCGSSAEVALSEGQTRFSIAVPDR